MSIRYRYCFKYKLLINYAVKRFFKMTELNVEDDLNSTKSYDDNKDITCDNNDYDKDVLKNGRFQTSIRLPHAFYSSIIGAKGSRIKCLEDETKTHITIPKQNNIFLITSPTELNLVDCKRRLEKISNDLRNNYSMTHFISFPMTSDEIKTNYRKFKELVLAEGHIDGVCESIFKNVDKIHLTIGILVLLDDHERHDAVELLEKCRREVILPQLASKSPLIIKMKGLDCMNNNPAKVDVLYSKVRVDNHENPDILQKISDDIMNLFCSHGIMRKEKDQVKLHATLINTRYRKDSNKYKPGKKYKRISFDARPILTKFGDFDFGQQQLDFIHLSYRTAVDDNGYYKHVHKITCK